MLHEETKAKRPPSAQQPTKAAASPGEKKSKPMDSRKYPCPNTNCTGIMVPRWPDPITYDAAVYVCPTCKQEVRVIKVLGIEDQ